MAQAEWLWTAIPFHPLTEEWKRPSFPIDDSVTMHAETVQGVKISYMGRLCQP